MLVANQLGKLNPRQIAYYEKLYGDEPFAEDNPGKPMACSL